MAEHRGVLYGSAIVVGASLLWMGFIHQPDPDLLTLVNTAEINLKQAAILPLTYQGKPNEHRAMLLQSAARDFARAERILLDLGETQVKGSERQDMLLSVMEFRAWGCFLNSDLEGASRQYASCLHQAGKDHPARPRITLSLATVYLKQGRPEGTLTMLDPLTGGELEATPAELAQAGLLASRALKMQGAPVDKVAEALARAAEAAPECPDTQAAVARLYEDHGLHDKALSHYQRAALVQPHAYIPLAILKYSLGDVEGATKALMALGRKDKAYLRAGLQREKGLANLADDPRLRELLAADRDK